MLKENEALLDALAEYLIEKETITGKEFMEIFNEKKNSIQTEEAVSDVPDANTDVEADAEKDTVTEEPETTEITAEDEPDSEE